MHKFSIGFLLIVTAVLGGCTDQSIDEAELQARLIQLTTRALDNQVFIEGATFTMGDFGAEGEDGVWRPYFPPTIEEDRPHEVTLSSYPRAGIDQSMMQIRKATTTSASRHR